MSTYAKGTTVNSDATRAEIERTLKRYGADGFMYGWETDRAIIGFRMRNRHVRFLLPFPTNDEITLTPTGKRRTPEQQSNARAQALRERWRALLLIVKAKLEAVQSGITEFDDEFLAHIVLPDGSTAGEWLKPQIAIAYEHGDMPKLLPGPSQ